VQLSRRNLVTSSVVVVPDPLAELDAPLLMLSELLLLRKSRESEDSSTTRSFDWYSISF